MKPEKLQDAIGMIGDDLILEAKNIKKKSKGKILKMWISAVAAVLVMAFVGNVVIQQENIPVFMKVHAISEAEYPTCVPYPDDSLKGEEYDEAYVLWKKDQKERKASFDGDFENLEDFFTSSMKEFVSDSDVENTVISPLSMYLSLGIIAEVTDGNSRQQILDLLNVDTIDSLRQQVCDIFNYHYNDDGRVKSVVSNSLWLDSHLQYNQIALDELAEIYYVSSFQGEMGSDAYNKKLRAWINEQTNGFLEDKNGSIKMTEDTILNLANTISFEAEWIDMFLPEDGYSGIFYTDGGEVTTNYCSQEIYRGYYYTDDFTAVKQEMKSGYGMWLIRPNDHTNAEALLDDEKTMEFIMSEGDNAEKKDMLVNLSLPVFDAYSEIDLSSGYVNMGLTDIFDDSLADFSPIIDNSDDVKLSSVQHNVRVTIDDKGENSDDYVTSSDENAYPENAEKTDLTLNKPFVFAITLDAGIPLFVGIVNQPL